MTSYSDEEAPLEEPKSFTTVASHASPSIGGNNNNNTSTQSSKRAALLQQQQQQDPSSSSTSTATTTTTTNNNPSTTTSTNRRVSSLGRDDSVRSSKQETHLEYDPVTEGYVRKVAPSKESVSETSLPPAPDYEELKRGSSTEGDVLGAMQYSPSTSGGGGGGGGHSSNINRLMRRSTAATVGVTGRMRVGSRDETTMDTSRADTTLVWDEQTESYKRKVAVSDQSSSDNNNNNSTTTNSNLARRNTSSVVAQSDLEANTTTKLLTPEIPPNHHNNNSASVVPTNDDDDLEYNPSPQQQQQHRSSSKHSGGNNRNRGSLDISPVLASTNPSAQQHPNNNNPDISQIELSNLNDSNNDDDGTATTTTTTAANDNNPSSTTTPHHHPHKTTLNRAMSSAAASVSGNSSNTPNKVKYLDDFTVRLFGGKKASHVEHQIEARLSPITKCFHKVWHNFVFESIWGILTLLGMSMSVFAWCIDEITEILVNFRGDLAKLKPSGGEKLSGWTLWAYELPPTAAFFAWWAWAIVFCMGAILVVKYVGPQAAGSGIEQVRSIMTGYPIPGYFEINTLFAKVVGLIFVQASGLTIGKEGPFVHISCSLAHLLLGLSFFREIKRSRQLTKQVISAACATGVSSTFGAPVGGVLFAIEVTSNVLHTADYWKAFFTAVVGEMLFRELSYFGTARESQVALFPTTFNMQAYTLSEIPFFFILSFICGLYGGFYVKGIIGVRTWRQNTYNKAVQWCKVRKDPQQRNAQLVQQMSKTTLLGKCFACCCSTDTAVAANNATNNIYFVISDYFLLVASYVLTPMGWALTVITLTAWINWFSGQFMQRSLYAGIADLLVSGQMARDWGGTGQPADPRLHSTDWGSPNLMYNLWVYFIFKSFLCMIGLSLAVPTGTLIPMLAIGLSMGRIFGELVQDVGGVKYAPGGYAVVGASAFIAGATGAVSTAVIVFEITAQLSFMVPVLLAVILGRAAGKLISPDLYEALQIMKHLPNIPPLARQESYNKTCAEVMNPDNIPMLKRYCTVEEVSAALDARSFRHEDAAHEDDLFAVVENLQSPIYLGSIARHQLSTAVSASDAGGAGHDGQQIDLLTQVNANAVAPAIPASSSISDALYLFELTLCSALFVTDHSRVVGWLDLATVRHDCESGHL
jgi:H+/Cl- antiporter ClcA